MADTDSDQQATRFEATISPGDRQFSMADVRGVDVDWMPGPREEGRAMVTAAQAAALVERGFRVHLLRAHPVQPLDPALVMDRDRARAQLEDRLRGGEGGKGGKGGEGGDEGNDRSGDGEVG